MATGSNRFPTTRWSLVLAAQRQNLTAADALASLCAMYWAPVYWAVRRFGHPAETAQDLTQEFFARLLEKGSLQTADPERGRFRSFLFAAVRNFLLNEHDRKNAAKRGGGIPIVPLDVASEEGAYRHESVERLTPGVVFDRRWAWTTIDASLHRLGRHMAESGRGRQFEELRPYLIHEGEERYAELGRRLGMTEEAVKMAIHRLRRRFRETLRTQVLDTVASPDQVDGELQHLLEVLRG